MRLNSLAAFGLLSMFAGHSGCGGPAADSDTADGSADRKSVDIGPAGGTIEIAGLRLDVPAGALEKETRLTVTREASTAVRVKGAFDHFLLEPSGLVFKVPMTITLTPAETPDEHVVLLWSTMGSDVSYQVIESIPGQTLSFQNWHFSWVEDVGVSLVLKVCGTKGKEFQPCCKLGTNADGCDGNLFCDATNTCRGGTCHDDSQCGIVREPSLVGSFEKCVVSVNCGQVGKMSVDVYEPRCRIKDAIYQCESTANLQPVRREEVDCKFDKPQCRCDASNCPEGCCSGAGFCTVATAAACGAGGATCVTCTAGETCRSGKCGKCDLGSTACGSGCCDPGILCEDAALSKCACMPDCVGRACGDDPVCGISCGDCDPKATCEAGVCKPCEPNCAGIACGMEATCGTSCGDCESGSSCKDGACHPCEPACSGLECGPDPTCGASCGTCEPGASCKGGQCEAPECDGIECGPDPVSGKDCGSCPAGPCAAGHCCAGGPDCGGKACGDDGCGGSCGACANGQSCSGGACTTDCKADGDCGAGGSCQNGHCS